MKNCMQFAYKQISNDKWIMNELYILYINLTMKPTNR